MQTTADYMARTESAVRKLFEGIESYVGLLAPIRDTTYVSGQVDLDKFRADYDVWAERNAEALARSRRAQEQYVAESFAMSTLCGAVLQVAAKAIECYSTNQEVPTDWRHVIPTDHPAARFCIGRPVRGVPEGLVVYAGRNQHTHYNEGKLKKVNEAIFDRIARFDEPASLRGHRDPALDLQNPLIDSFASNITYVLGWRSYENYSRDLRQMLGL